jgi:hypothetical protein
MTNEKGLNLPGGDYLEPYRDEFIKLTIDKPHSWEVQHTPEYTTLLLAPVTPNVYGSSFVGISVMPVPQDSDDLLEEAARQVFALQEQQGEEYESGQEQQITINGYPAWMQHSHWKTLYETEAVVANHLLIVTQTAARLYTLRLMFINDKANMVWTLIQHLIKSIRFDSVPVEPEYTETNTPRSAVEQNTRSGRFKAVKRS